TPRASSFFFFFQAEDGIRDFHVTGVQTCALPISRRRAARAAQPLIRSGPSSVASVHSDTATGKAPTALRVKTPPRHKHAPSVGQIGRASCRERVEIAGGGVSVTEKAKGGGKDQEV